MRGPKRKVNILSHFPSLLTRLHNVTTEAVSPAKSREEAPSAMHNDGILQVSSISRLQAAVISPGTLHPPPGIPLSPHTRPGPGRLHDNAAQKKNPPYKPCIHKLSAVYKTCKAVIASAAEHEPRQIKCVRAELRLIVSDSAWGEGKLRRSSDRKFTACHFKCVPVNSTGSRPSRGALGPPAHSQQVTLSASCNAEQKSKKSQIRCSH